jgi:hypothetical protein
VGQALRKDEELKGTLQSLALTMVLLNQPSLLRLLNKLFAILKLIELQEVLLSW